MRVKFHAQHLIKSLSNWQGKSLTSSQLTIERASFIYDLRMPLFCSTMHFASGRVRRKTSQFVPLKRSVFPRNLI